MQQSNNFYSVIGKECHPEWEIVEEDGKLYFSNPQYKTRTFDIGLVQEFDENKNEIKRNMYPISDPEHDPYNLCFNINYHNNNYVLIPNKLQNVFNRRKEKRLNKYIKYRQQREKTKKECELLNPPKKH
jgi:hypothetical protein